MSDGKVIPVDFRARRRIGSDVRIDVYDRPEDAARSVAVLVNAEGRRVVALVLPDGFDGEALALDAAEARDVAEALLAAADDAEA